MNVNLFPKNLKYLREKNNYTQDQLASKLNIKRSRLSNWEKGTRDPSMEHIVAISKFFGEDLIHEDLKMRDFTKHSINIFEGVRIPVLGRIPAGIPIEAIQDVLEWEEIPKSWTTGGREYFALKIMGDSMEPVYNNEDVVIFLKNIDCETGTDCAVMVNGNDATFKKVCKQDKGIILRPINPKYEATFYSTEDITDLPLTIIGIAKEIRRKVK